MQNIEIKVKCEDLQRAENIAKKVGAKFESSIHQRDTYFIIKKGRLKLREISTGVNQLIYYNRPNEAGPKTSEYYIYPVEASGQLKKCWALLWESGRPLKKSEWFTSLMK